MSDIKKDERLEELMTEFLETSDESGVKSSSDTSSRPELDNKKMLGTIEAHRNEIEELKSQIEALQLQVQEQADVTEPDKEMVVAPEVIALQTLVADHGDQIKELIHKHDQIRGDIKQQDATQKDQMHDLKGQVDALSEEVKKVPEVVEKHTKGKGATPKEMAVVQSTISQHTSKIGDLEYKHKMLKTDVERKQEEKKGTFGSLGWLLLISNVLLWSVLAFFFWSNNQNKTIELIGENSSRALMPPAHKQDIGTQEKAEAGHEGITEEGTTAAPSVDEHAMQTESHMNPDASLTDANKENSREIKPEQVAASNSASVHSVRKRNQTARRKRARSSRKVVRRRSSSKPRKRTLGSSSATNTGKSKPATNEPDVSFGD